MKVFLKVKEPEKQTGNILQDHPKDTSHDTAFSPHHAPLIYGRNGEVVGEIDECGCPWFY